MSHHLSCQPLVLVIDRLDSTSWKAGAASRRRVSRLVSQMNPPGLWWGSFHLRVATSQPAPMCDEVCITTREVMRRPRKFNKED